MGVKLHVELPKSIKPFLSKGNLSDLADIALSISFCYRSNLSMTEHLPYLKLQQVIWTIVSVSACQAALCFMTNPLNINDLRFSLVFISLSPQRSPSIFSAAPTLALSVYFIPTYRFCKFQLKAFLPWIIGDRYFHIHGYYRCRYCFPI